MEVTLTRRPSPFGEPLGVRTTSDTLLVEASLPGVKPEVITSGTAAQVKPGPSATGTKG